MQHLNRSNYFKIENLRDTCLHLNRSNYFKQENLRDTSHKSVKLL